MFEQEGAERKKPIFRRSRTDTFGEAKQSLRPPRRLVSGATARQGGSSHGFCESRRLTAALKVKPCYPVCGVLR
jgi:hypothetical protein